MPFITQANESAAAKRQEGESRRRPGRPRNNRRGDEVEAAAAVEETEDNSRLAEFVETLDACAHDPNPNSAVNLIREGDDADIPATQTADVPATAPLLRASTQVGM